MGNCKLPNNGKTNIDVSGKIWATVPRGNTKLPISRLKGIFRDPLIQSTLSPHIHVLIFSIFRVNSSIPIPRLPRQNRQIFAFEFLMPGYQKLQYSIQWRSIIDVMPISHQRKIITRTIWNISFLSEYRYGCYRIGWLSFTN